MEMTVKHRWSAVPWALSQGLTTAPGECGFNASAREHSLQE